MIKISRKILAAAVLISLITTGGTASAANTPDRAANADTAFNKLSYAIGMSMAHDLKSMDMNEIDYDDFMAGMISVLENTPQRITDDEARSTIRAFLSAVEEQRRTAASNQARINAEEGENFLTENGKRTQVVTTPSGLQYEVLKEGDGPMPSTGDKVTVHYTGRLLNGKVFDSSVDRGEPTTFGVNQVIPGWTEALMMMKQGSKWRLFIPSSLAYGPNGAGGVIGPNATLIFDVELLKVDKAEN